MRLFIYILLMFLPISSNAQIGLVGNAGSRRPAAVSSSTIAAVFTRTVSGTNVTTTTVNATSATQVFVGVGYRYQTSTPVAITDNGGHTWNIVRQNESSTNNQSGAIIYEAHGTFSSAFSVTVTCNLCGVSAIGFSGTTATTVDQANGVFNSSAGSSDSPGSITTTRSNNVVMSVFYNAGNTNNPALPSGWTDGGYFPFGTTFPCRVIYKINTSTSTENPVYSVTAGGNDALVIGDE